MKFCKKCGCETERNSSGGCKPCAREASAAWRAANPDKAKAVSAAYRAANREKELARHAAWHAANRNKTKARKAEWHLANREMVLGRCAAWRSANQDRKRATDAAYHKANPDRNRVHGQNRRARRREAGGRLSAGLTERLFKLQRGKCACGCKQSLGHDFHLDHIMPLALGGTNTDDNIQILRATCNLQKQAKHPVDFMRQNGFLL